MNLNSPDRYYLFRARVPFANRSLILIIEAASRESITEMKLKSYGAVSTSSSISIGREIKSFKSFQNSQSNIYLQYSRWAALQLCRQNSISPNFFATSPLQSEQSQLLCNFADLLYECTNANILVNKHMSHPIHNNFERLNRDTLSQPPPPPHALSDRRDHDH